MKRLTLLLCLFNISMLFLFSVTPVFARQREGVDIPYPITSQKFDITDGQFVYYSYELLLDRTPDDQGGVSNMRQLEDPPYQTRQQVFLDLMNSSEFRTNSKLTDNTEYVNRLYSYVLHRPADSQGLQAQLQAIQDSLAAGKSKGEAWYGLFLAFLGSSENAKNCTTQAYSYETQLKPDAPSLTDLFAGKAHFQPTSELNSSNLVNLDLTGAGTTGDKGDQKFNIIHSPDNNSYIGFARAILPVPPGPRVDIFMFTSPDGVNFSQAKRVFGDRNTDFRSVYGLLDPQVSIDYSYCPKRYVMSIQCDSDFCVSESSTPQYAWSWSKPKDIVKHIYTENPNGTVYFLSPAPGAMAIDKDGTRYAYWTACEEPHRETNPDVTASCYTMGTRLTSPGGTLSATDGTTLMSAEKNIYCTSSWDCNNKDKEDVKYEDGYYYLAYHGSNYSACERFPQDLANGHTSDWGLSVARSTNPLGNFDNDTLGKLLDSIVKDTCGIQYPAINNINGELYLYFSVVDRSHGFNNVRSKLVWNNLLSDLNSDGNVNIFDYNLLVGNFGKTGSNLQGDIDGNGKIDIFDYNQLVGNFGK